MKHALIAALASVAVASALAPERASAEAVSSLRLMLHPRVAGDEPAQLARLQSLAALGWRAAGTSRTGALELELAAPRDRAQLEPTLRALRSDRAVLWVDTPRASFDKLKRGSAAIGTTRRLTVMLAPGVEPDWPTLLPRFATLVGRALSVERRIDDVWVLAMPDAVALADALFAAERLQNDPAVRAADAVKRFHPSRVPGDALFDLQWGLWDPVSGIDAPLAWDTTTGSAELVVAVVDTGIVAHPELEGRLVRGYDFVSDPLFSNDGDGRDADPTDPGDWFEVEECEGAQATYTSSWHGTIVAGIIGARGDNGNGVAGIDWNARIQPVRVLGKCGGSELDVLEGLKWASGAPVNGTPPNTTPARVINLSLGGLGPCSASMQRAVDEALAQGAVVVAAAGNEGEDVADFSPANCSGVIAVSAHTRMGVRTGYSNWGTRVDISAPGGDGEIEDWILSTSNDGELDVGEPISAYAIGTSFAAPHVAGTASLLIARNRNLTAGRLLATLQGAARAHPSTSSCAHAPLCGPGLLDAGAAMAMTPTPLQSIPPAAVAVVEYYRADLDQYFVTADPAEMAMLDLFGAWQRTGEVFYAYASPDAAPGLQPVCRFVGNRARGLESHYFTRDAGECAYVRDRWAGTWLLENPAAFYLALPDAAGRCAADALPVLRFFNGKQDVNHRYTTDLTVRRAMVNRGWIPDGTASEGVSFCSPG